MRRFWYASVLSAVAVLAAAGCAQPSSTTDSDPLAHAPGQVHFYGTDGNMLNGIGDLLAKDHPNSLVGMKGTTPLSRKAWPPPSRTPRTACAVWTPRSSTRRSPASRTTP